VWPSPGAKALIVLFHGAINRDNRTYPEFLEYRAGVHRHAHQIAIADPSLALSEKLSNGWFAGATGTQLQKLLPPFLARLIEHLQVDRVIFAGSSGGGFAALYYSWQFPDSTAVVAVPQTNVHQYYESRRTAYLEASWPAEINAPQGSTTPCLDLRTIYSTGMRNTVVYIQSNMDLFHVENHMTPFVSALPSSAVKRLILKCSFWGKLSHSGAVPVQEMDAWIRAVLSADEQTTESISMAYHLTNPGVAPSPSMSKQNTDRGTPPKALDPIDQQWTAKIASEMLR